MSPEIAPRYAIDCLRSPGVPTLPQAVRLGWEPAWVALAALTISLSLMTTILAGIASRKIHKRTLFFFGLLGVTKPLIASDCLWTLFFFGLLGVTKPLIASDCL